MFESFTQKSESEKPVDLQRRKVLGAMGVAIGGTALGGALLAQNNEKPTETSTVVSPDTPAIESSPLMQPESIQQGLMNIMTKNLESGSNEAYVYAIEFISTLNAEVATLLKRQSLIIDMLTELTDTDPKNVFCLLEHDRIQKSLTEIQSLIAECQTAIQKSPLYGTDVTVTPKPEEYLKKPYSGTVETATTFTA